MSKEFTLTPSKGPYVGRTLSDVHLLRHELDVEKLKNRKLAQTVRQIIDVSKLPKEEFTWYKLLGGNTMRHTRKIKRGGQPAALPGSIAVTPQSAHSPLRTPHTATALPGSIAVTPQSAHNPLRTHRMVTTALPGSIALTPQSGDSPLRTPHTGKSRKHKKVRRLKRGGQPTPPQPPRNPWTPAPAWQRSLALGATPGTVAMPPIPTGPPSLTRSSATIIPPPSSSSLPPISPSFPTARRLEFGTSPGCVPIYKRLPGHAPDQCEASENADAMDRLMCLQPGQGQVQALSDCGPTTRRGGKHKRNTKKIGKTRRISRNHRRHIRRRGGSLEPQLQHCDYDSACNYSPDNKHNWGLVGRGNYRCQNVLNGVRCPCYFDDY